MKLEVIALVMALVLMSGGMAVEQTAPTTATVTVNQFLSVTLSNVPVTFPNMNPGSGPTAANVGNGYPLTATIGAETNVGGIFVKTRGAAQFCTDYSNCAGSKFGVGNMTWDDASTGPWAAYTTLDATVCSGLSASGTCNIYHQLTIPGNQAAGAYSTGITITATSV